MSEKKIKIISTVGEVLPSMTEAEKTYLMGFLEGVAAIAGLDGLTKKTA